MNKLDPPGDAFRIKMVTTVWLGVFHQICHTGLNNSGDLRPLLQQRHWKEKDGSFSDVLSAIHFEQASVVYGYWIWDLWCAWSFATRFVQVFLLEIKPLNCHFEICLLWRSKHGSGCFGSRVSCPRRSISPVITHLISNSGKTASEDDEGDYQEEPAEVDELFDGEGLDEDIMDHERRRPFQKLIWSWNEAGGYSR